MIRSGPTLEPDLAPWLPAWALAVGLSLWPRPALASDFDGPQWVGAGLALGLFLLVVLAATWILRKPSAADMESGTGVVPPTQSPVAPLPAPLDFADSRLGRLQQGLGRRRRAIAAGKDGFPGDTEVMARFLDGCGRMQRGEAPPVPPGRQLPPGTLTRLSRLYDQLLSANPARARDWQLQRTSISSQIRRTLGQGDTNRFLELLDGLAKRRVERQKPTPEEATGWSEFLAQFRDTPADRAPLASSPDAELAVAEDVPTSDLLTLTATQASEDPPTVDTDLLFPGRATAAGEEDAPTVDTDLLFPGRAAGEESVLIFDTDLFIPASAPSEERPRAAASDERFTASSLAEEDAPTVDAENLFPAAEEDAPTVDTEHLFPLAEEDAPTVDTENLFPTRKFVPAGEDEEDPEDDAPTVDTFRLFKEGPSAQGEGEGQGEAASSPARRKRRRAKPTRASFTETDELLDPVEDAPTRDTADLFGKE